jgi:hypothetical protein
MISARYPSGTDSESQSLAKTGGATTMLTPRGYRPLVRRVPTEWRVATDRGLGVVHVDRDYERITEVRPIVARPVG